MFNFYSQLRRILPIYNQYFEETEATQNSFQTLSMIQNQVQIRPKEFNQLYVSQPSLCTVLSELQEFPQMSRKILMKNNTYSEQFQKQIPMLIAMKRKSINYFLQHTQKNGSKIELITSSFLNAHCKLKIKNQQILTLQNSISQPTQYQLKVYNVRIETKDSRSNYRSLEIIKKVWTKYYYHYLNGNRIYINSAMSLNSLLQQYWIKQLNMQKFMAYVPQKQFYKTINLQSEQKNIKSIFKCFDIIKINKTTLSKAQEKIKNLLLQDMSKIETHDKYQNQIIKAKNIEKDVRQHITKFVTQYGRKCEILIKNFDLWYHLLLKFYQSLNKNIKQMEDNHQKQKKIKNDVKIFINIQLNAVFTKILATFSVFDQIQKQLIAQAKLIQLFYKQFNEIFKGDQKHKYYVSDQQRQIVEKHLLDFQKEEYSFVENVQNEKISKSLPNSSELNKYSPLDVNKYCQRLYQDLQKAFKKEEMMQKQTIEMVQNKSNKRVERPRPPLYH